MFLGGLVKTNTRKAIDENILKTNADFGWCDGYSDTKIKAETGAYGGLTAKGNNGALNVLQLKMIGKISY